MKKLAAVLAIASLNLPLLLSSNAQTGTAQGGSKVSATTPVTSSVTSAADTSRNGYLSLQQAAGGVDVLPAAAAGVDTLEYSAGALSLVHNLGSAVPLATTESTVAKAHSFASVPTACPDGQALNAMDAKGNAVTCISVKTLLVNPVGGTGSSFLYTYSQPVVQAGDTVGSTSTLFATQGTIPANVLVAGTVIEMDASGTYDITTAQEPGAGIIWIRVGGIRMAATNFQTSLVVGKNYLWTAHFKGIVRLIGTSGTLDPLLTATSSLNQWGGRMELAAFNPTQPVDTLAINAVQIEFINAFSGDSATLRQMTVTVR